MIARRLWTMVRYCRASCAKDDSTTSGPLEEPLRDLQRIFGLNDVRELGMDRLPLAVHEPDDAHPALGAPLADAAREVQDLEDGEALLEQERAGLGHVARHVDVRGL